MDKTIMVYIALFGVLWTIAQFWLKNSLEQLKLRRESGAIFFTEVSKCLSKIKYKTQCDIECVTFESYSNFLIHLSQEDGQQMMICWEDYLKTLDGDCSNETTIEALECLWINILYFTEPLTISGLFMNSIEKIKHWFHSNDNKSEGCIYCK